MNLPENSRFWIGGGVAATVVVLAVGWIGLVHPELSGVATQRSETDSARTANDALQAKVTTLQTESRQLSTLVHSLAVARNQLPIQADLPTYIRQLGGQARTAKVGLTNLAIGAVSLSTVAGVAAATAATGSTDTTDTSTAAAATPSPTATDSSTPTTAVAPVVAAGPAGELFQIQVSVTTTGSFAHQRAFLTAIQLPGTRAALVSSVELAPAAAAATPASPSPGADAAESATSAPASVGASSDLTTIMTIFVAPQTPAAAAELTKQLASRAAR